MTAALIVAPLSGTLASADRLERVGADLSSDVVSIRREARRQLAIELQRSSASDLRTILEGAATQNYRQQLGVLVAIDKAKDLPPLAGGDKTAVTKCLSTIESKSKDATLLGASKAARGKLGL